MHKRLIMPSASRPTPTTINALGLQANPTTTFFSPRLPGQSPLLLMKKRKIIIKKKKKKQEGRKKDKTRQAQEEERE